MKFKRNKWFWVMVIALVAFLSLNQFVVKPMQKAFHEAQKQNQTNPSGWDQKYQLK